MALTKEQIQKAMECKTADELLALAKSWGVEMTREQAEEYIANMQTRELTESELKQVAGGECDMVFKDCKWRHPHCKGQESPISPCVIVCTAAYEKGCCDPWED